MVCLPSCGAAGVFALCFQDPEARDHDNLSDNDGLADP
jgi:hypothetical protein